MIIDGQSTIEISLGKYPTLCYWVNAEENTISNKIFIQDLDQLDVTNPSRTGRTVNQFLSKIEEDGYNVLDITEIERKRRLSHDNLHSQNNKFYHLLDKTINHIISLWQWQLKRP
jgi:hypothetical protein